MSFLNDLAEGDETLSYNEHMYEELYKMKIRMKKINSNMEKQYDLLRLVVQKMEIHTEDDNRDEGFSESYDVVANIQKTSRWTPAKNNLVRQSAIVSQWKHSLSDAV